MNPTRDSLRSPGMRIVTTHTSSRQPPIEFYRAPGILVTSEIFAVADRHFPVRGLTRLHMVRGPRDPLAVRAVFVALAALTGIGMMLGYGGGPHWLRAGAYLVLTTVALASLLLTVVSSRLRPPGYELWGRYRGLNVLLFRCPRERQFGQVTRALLRAREVARLGGGTVNSVHRQSL